MLKLLFLYSICLHYFYAIAIISKQYSIAKSAPAVTGCPVFHLVRFLTFLGGLQTVLLKTSKLLTTSDLSSNSFNPEPPNGMFSPHSIIDNLGQG